VKRLERWHLPSAAAAAIVVLALLALLVALGAAFEGPVRSMASDLPKSVNAARGKLDALSARLRSFTSSASRQTAGQGAQSAQGGQAAPGAARANAAPSGAQPGGASSQSGAANSSPSAPPAGSAGSSPSSGGINASGAQGALRSAFGITTALLAEIVEEVLLVFFLLAAGRSWMEKLGRITSSPQRERVWPSIAGEMHDVVARYLLVTLLINAVQAAVIGLALWALGVPTPLLWGALTFVAEFVPYLGGIVMIALLTAAGLATNQGVGHALLAPATYLVVTTLQNNLVSPVAYGRGLRLNPTVILLGVMFWWMVWGVAGAFLAVPILASLRVLGSRIPSLEPMAIVLEE
jgi:predicted PurR-regulated permease PerM